MIAGRIDITPRAVETHKDSYLLAHLTVVSVRRPLLATGVTVALGGGAFCVRFIDLLYPQEILVFSAVILLALLLGLAVGQIQLLSRDLRGTALSGMIWGSYGHLNSIRRQIVKAMHDQDERV
ncbi:MAG: hypothetical protein AAFY02_16220 [Pseudomonadota bacterium]